LFEISSIDSIGNFLPFHQPGLIEFRNYTDSIVVRSGSVDPYVVNAGSCCHLVLRILPAEKLEAYDGSGKRIKAKAGHQNVGIWLSQSKQAQERGKKNIHATLKRKN